jgi:G:T-mismatch repair DNA endonuclease (very short patch repair protein)
MEQQDWARLYRILAATGLPAPTVPVAEEGRDPLPIGWPEVKVGIAYSYTDTKAWEKADWSISVLGHTVTKALPDVLVWLDELLFAHLLRGSEATAEQSVSKTERAVLSRLLQRGLPDPDRNHRIIDPSDGRLVTVPDFVWADRKVAVFVDGSFWHGGKSLNELTASVNGDPKRRAAIQARFRNKAAADAANRRFMTARGWVCIALSDKTVDDGAADLDAAIDDIVSAWHAAS